MVKRVKIGKFWVEGNYADSVVCWIFNSAQVCVVQRDIAADHIHKGKECDFVYLSSCGMFYFSFDLLTGRDIFCLYLLVFRTFMYLLFRLLCGGIKININMKILFVEEVDKVKINFVYYYFPMFKQNLYALDCVSLKNDLLKLVW